MTIDWKVFPSTPVKKDYKFRLALASSISAGLQCVLRSHHADNEFRPVVERNRHSRCSSSHSERPSMPKTVTVSLERPAQMDDRHPAPENIVF